MILFCPTCQTYLSDADVCPACGQPRPQPPAATPHWTVPLNVAAYGTPVVAGGLPFLLTSEGMPVQHTTLLALDLSTREVRWRCRLDNLLVNDPVLAHGDALAVAARSTDPLGEGLLLALDAASGKERWRWTPGAQAVSAPTLVDGVLYVTLDGGELWSVEASSGDKGWHLQLPMPRSVTAPLASPDVPHRLFLPSRGPHLCAVDITSRKVVWHYTSPDDAGDWFLKTPALAGSRLFAVSTGGAVLALDAETGDQLWRVVPGQAGKPLTAPAVAGQRVFVGGHDHYIYALDTASGETLWRRETARRIEGRPLLLDGVLYVAGHDHYLRALDATTGRDLWLVELLRRIEGGPALAGDVVLAADREGNVVAVERVLAAETYAAQARWPEAAAAYARRGDLPAAARIYEERLNEPFYAAELWWAAECPRRAAPLYRQAGAEDKALVAYRQAAGDYLQAGERYAAVGAWAKAGEQYEHAGRPDLAASAFEKAGLTSRAAECYEQAEHWADAANLYETLRQWAKAIDCYGRAEHWADAGRIQSEHLNDWAAAARSYVLAAKSVQGYRAVGHWVRARDSYRQIGDEDHANECQCEIARLRGLPHIQVHIEAENVMCQGEYHEIICEVNNAGGGVARHVFLHHTESEFVGDLQETMEIHDVLPGRSVRKVLYLRALVAGRRVPLDVTVTYADKHGQSYEIRHRQLLTVRRTR